MATFSSRLRLAFTLLTEELADLIRDLRTHRMERNGPGVTIVAPEFWWDELTAAQRLRQLEISRRYTEWFELLTLALAEATPDLRKKLQRADARLRKWLELRQNWSLRADPEVNATHMKEASQHLSQIVEILEAAASGLTIVIPDTNTITANPDPTAYRSAVGEDAFVFLLLPTVLTELDDLKNNHRNESFRTKVQKAIKRIKGWRTQGSLIEGVTVDGTITVQAVATDPDMESSLSWLVKENRDDRIIASTLELQARSPSSRVVLVTGDVNLMNKADVALIETVEFP